MTATPPETIVDRRQGHHLPRHGFVHQHRRVGAGITSAAITLSARDTTPAEELNGWPIAGANIYLMLIGFLGFALSILLRSVIPPLVTMLGIVLIVSPLIRGSTQHARWLPDRAGSLLYLPTVDSPLTAGTGALILLAWIAVTAASRVAVFVARDA